MLNRNKTYSICFALLYLTAASVCGYAQGKIKKETKIEKQAITVGFQTGRELLFNTTPLLHSKQSKVHYGISKSLVLRKPLNSHFKLEAGLSYTSIQTTPNPFSFTGKQNNNLKANSFALPVTIQYYLLPEKCRIRPFCGAGLQCNLSDHKSNPPITTSGMDVIPQYNTPPQSDTKYITSLFTQGVTFEVNTKIEVSQSFHFIPENNNTVIGINLGVGYKIP